MGDSYLNGIRFATTEHERHGHNDILFLFSAIELGDPACHIAGARTSNFVSVARK